MRLAHDPAGVDALRRPTEQAPLRVLVSGCLAGLPCGVDGTDYGLGARLADLLTLPTLAATSFCPEDHGLGTPRTMPDIHGGDGRSVLEGRSRILDEHGADLTDAMIAGAEAMLACAIEARVELAILTDMSAACGTQVISLGCRVVPQQQRRYQRGVGVAAAMLLEHGIPCVSQRDFRTLGRIRQVLEPGFEPSNEAIDHHDSAWYRTYFADSLP
jgi:uncharacterized protein YbbK (DUF523 family)